MSNGSPGNLFDSPHFPMMSQLYRVIAVLLLALSGAGVAQSRSGDFSEDWRWVQFTTESGLPSNRVVDIIEARDGVVWAVTGGGFAWYDGYRWHEVVEQEERPFIPPMWVAPAPAGGLLAVFHRRPYLYTTDGIRPITVPDPVDSGSLRVVVGLDTAHLFVMEDRGFFLTTTDGKLLADLPSPETSVTYFPPYYTAARTIWVNTTSGVYRWNGKSWSTKFKIDAISPIRIAGLVESRGGEVLLSIRSPLDVRGLWEWREPGVPKLVREEGQEIIKTMDLAPDGTALVVYKSGIVRRKQGGGWSTMSPVPGQIREALVIRYRSNGDLWVGTERGLYLFRQSLRRWTSWSNPFPSVFNTVHAILKDRRGQVWVGTPGGLEVYQPDGSCRIITTVDGTLLDGVTGLCEGDDGSVWVTSGGAGFRGAFRYIGNSWRHYGEAQGLRAPGVHRIVRARDGSLWFLGLGTRMEDSVQPGIYIFDHETFRYWEGSDHLESKRVYALVEAPDSSIWIGTRKALSRVRNGGWMHWPSGGGIFSIAGDNDGKIWFCERDKMFGYIDRDDRRHYLTSVEGVTDNDVWDLGIDHRGTLWVGTRTNGLVGYHDGTWSPFSISVGLSNPTLWPIVPVGDSLYIGTDGSGVVILNLSEAANPVPDVEISEPAIDDNNATIRWSADAYWGEVPSGDIRVRFRLDGQEWSPWSVRRSIKYNLLSSGGHKFEIQAKNLFGYYDSAGTVSYFSIAPRLYERPSFVVPIGLLSMTVLYLGFTLILRRRRFNREIREREARLNVITESTASAIFILQDGTILFANSSAERLTGYPRTELVSRPFETLIVPEQRSMVIDKIYPPAHGMATQNRFECRIERQDGEERWIDCLIGTIEYQGSTAVLGTAIDTTDRKSAEEKLIRHQEMLQTLTSELARTEERERRRMATYLHNYVGQALAMCRQRLGMPGKTMGDDDLAALRRYVDQATHHTQSLTFDLSPPVLYELSFEEAIEWLTEEVERDHQLPVSLNTEGHIPEIDQDSRAFLFHVVRELLLNVVRHAEAYSARVVLKTDDESVTIIVQDDGKGYDPEVVREHDTGKTGFGLFSIRERVNYLGGKMDIATRLGEGTSVTLVFPRRNLLRSQHNSTA